MKKLFLGILFFFILCGTSSLYVYAEDNPCSFNVDVDNPDITSALQGCLEGDDSTLVKAGNVSIGGGSEDGFKARVENLVRTLGAILGLLAVGAIVYGALMLVLSQGEEEKLKKGKDIVKWAILGFLALVFASGLITIVINIMFSI